MRQKFVVLGVLGCEVYWKEHVDDGKNNEGLTRRRVEMRDVDGLKFLYKKFRVSGLR